MPRLFEPLPLFPEGAAFFLQPSPLFPEIAAFFLQPSPLLFAFLLLTHLQLQPGSLDLLLVQLAVFVVEPRDVGLGRPAVGLGLDELRGARATINRCAWRLDTPSRSGAGVSS